MAPLKRLRPLVQRLARHRELQVRSHLESRRAATRGCRPPCSYRRNPMSARLSSGGRVDRKQVVNFSFNGRAYQGLAGDTLASALLANGVSLVARSWKYHRPRGILSAGVEEPNALV